MDFSDSESTSVQESPVNVEAGEITKPLSLAARFVGVFTKPSSTFENLAKAGPRKSDWLVSMIMYSLIALAVSMLVNSNPAYYRDLQDEVWRKFDRVEERMQSGELSKKDGISQQIGNVHHLDMLDRIGNDRKTYHAHDVFIGIVQYAVEIFFIALIYWFMVSIVVRGRTTFAFILSSYGLVLYIEIMEKLLTAILLMVTGNYAANISPTLFMRADVSSLEFVLLSSLNPFKIMQYYVLGIAFHKIGGVSRTRGMIASFTPWVLLIVIVAFVLALI